MNRHPRYLCCICNKTEIFQCLDLCISSVLQDTALGDRDDPQGVRDVRQGISVEDHEVRELSLLERADITLEPERERAARRGHSKHLVVRDTGAREQRELEVDTQPVGHGRGVRPDAHAPAGADEARNRSLQGGHRRRQRIGPLPGRLLDRSEERVGAVAARPRSRPPVQPRQRRKARHERGLGGDEPAQAVLVCRVPG